MKQEIVYELYLEEKASLSKAQYNQFMINYQRAVLLSIVEQGMLTTEQFTMCMDRIKMKYAETEADCREEAGI